MSDANNEVLWDDGSPAEEVETEVEAAAGEEIPQEGEEDQEDEQLEDGAIEIDYENLDYSKVDIAKVLANNPNLRFSQKVNGKEEQVSLSWDKMRQDYQKYQGANSKFDETNKLKGEIDLARENFKTNPRDMFEKAGINPEDWISDEIDRMAEEAGLTPEQRQIRDLEKEKDQWKAKEAAREKVKEDKLIEKFAEQRAATLKEEIPEAINKLGLPHTEATVQAIAKVKYEASKYQDVFLTVEEAALIVKDDMSNFYKAHLGELSPEQLAEFMGEAQEKKFRKHSLDKFNNKQQKKQPVARREEVKKDNAAPSVSFEDIFG